MNIVIENIKNLLNTINEAAYVDEDWGQLDYYSPNFPMEWPCILIDFSSGKFDNVGRDKNDTLQHRQTANVLINITFATLKASNSNQEGSGSENQLPGLNNSNSTPEAPENQEESTYNIWKLVQKGHELLHGWRPLPNSGILTRASFKHVKRDDGVQEIVVVYSLGLTNA